jgi:hypothetical protein
VAAVAVGGGIDKVRAEPHQEGVLALEVQLIRRDRRRVEALLNDRTVDVIAMVIIRIGNPARAGSKGHGCR